MRNSKTVKPTTHASGALVEAERLMTVCNSCRYCEGLCAVFPAMERRRAFPDGDLNYLANLCHACGACYVDCQFSPPHEFNVNVPRVLAEVRADSYAAYAWPARLASLFRNNGVTVAWTVAVAVAVFVAGFVAGHEPRVLFAAHEGPGAFYRLMPHNTMAVTFGAVFLYAIIALVLGVRRMWRSIGGPSVGPVDLAAIVQAARDAARLRYLDGGGSGCSDGGALAPDRRRHAHHATFYGFVLCFAATSVATVYHYAFGRIAPYAWWDLPVVLGTLGGIGLIVGPIGLLRAKFERGEVLVYRGSRGMDVAFLWMLMATSITGLALLVARATPAMGVLLAVHLGVVLALFLTMPYGKFVHGVYRFAALVRHALEQRDA